MGGVWGWMGVVWVVRGGCGRSVGVDGCNVGGEGWMWMGVVWVVRGGCGRSVGVDGCSVGGEGWMWEECGGGWV